MTTLNTRRYDLDWLRIIAFLLLIFYHIGMFYVPWEWHVKSVHAGPGAEPFMLLLNPWRLSLLFFISGVALRFLFGKLGASGLARDRTVRMGLPIIAGMVLIVAPQSWLQLVESGEFEGSFSAFYPQYLDPASDFSIITPTWNHLWYIVYLLVYSLLLAPVAGPLIGFMEGRGAALTRRLFAGRVGMAMVIVLPALPHMLYRVTLDPAFETTHNLVWDWANHAHSLTILMIGFLLAKDEAFWGAVRRALLPAVLLAVTVGAGLTALWLVRSGHEANPSWLLTAYELSQIFYAWLAILSLLALAQRYLNRPSAALTYMTGAVFPWYILHQTLIVMAGFWLTRQGLSAGVEAGLLVLATLGGCALLHEGVIRRVAWLRPWFGLKPKGAPRRVRMAKPGTA
ncbi:acyltransferase family protein [Henriciella aquimarina]|uniref:acyltransferase family protein n=1 Tax=Henriciella aquimarina TaxID=545261 RepID=UPI0009FF20CB|nr:acyltransferase family protein [Henriciella aquimarina]